ncbi:MAG: EI24 domain-containing protein [Planctomycetes bacterium]|nr:EI24 domain-containing protein [Planctomycetota bacterium]
MVHAFVRALGILFDRRILGVLGACAMLSALTFVALWWVLHWLLTSVLVDTGPVQRVLDWLGVLAALIAAWFLFPVVTSAFVGLFLDRVARIVEARHYPLLPPATGLPWHQALLAALQFFGLMLLANAALLLLWFFPLAYPVGFFVVNGLLLGREYYDLVSQRRLDLPAARALRRRHEPELILTGAGITFLLTVPFVNLIAPVFATAAMVHRFESWRRPAAQAGGG